MINHRSHRRAFLSTAAITGLLLTAGCAGSAGTAGAPGGGGSGAADQAALYTGAWEGEFDVGMAAGGLAVVLNHDGTVWTGDMTLDAEGQSIGGAIENFAITEEGCTFSCFIEMADVFFNGRLEEGALVGIMEVYAESELVAEGTFVLKKK